MVIYIVLYIVLLQGQKCICIFTSSSRKNWFPQVQQFLIKIGIKDVVAIVKVKRGFQGSDVGQCYVFTVTKTSQCVCGQVQRRFESVNISDSLQHWYSSWNINTIVYSWTYIEQFSFPKATHLFHINFWMMPK